MPETVNPEPEKTVWADTTLQALNRRIGKEQLFFDKDMFEQSAPQWDGIPVIFQEAGYHPKDFEAVDDDPETAAKDLGGRVVGHVKDPRIEIEGHPRLVATLEISDSRVNELYRAGELGISTAFTCANDGDRIMSPPIPNHVLLFREVADQVEQGDPAAFVHSNHRKELPMEQKKSFLSKLRDLVSEAESEEVKQTNSELPQKNAEEPEPAASESDDEIAKKDAEISALKEQNASLESQIEALRSELASIQQADEQARLSESERKFNELLAALPEGMVKTEKQRHSLRQEFDADPIGTSTKFINSVITVKGETKPAGDRFTNSVDADPVQRGIGDVSPHARKN